MCCGQLNNISELIQDCDWTSLATTLYGDAKDWALMVPPSQPGDLVNMSAVINGLRDRFFFVDPGDEDYPKERVRNQKAKDDRNELRAKADLKKRAQDKLVQRMAE